MPQQKVRRSLRDSVGTLGGQAMPGAVDDDALGSCPDAVLQLRGALD
ncbi:hypothetical protein ACFVJ5_28595 [Nocardia sp. NPDC127606]